MGMFYLEQSNIRSNDKEKYIHQNPMEIPYMFKKRECVPVKFRQNDVRINYRVHRISPIQFAPPKDEKECRALLAKKYSRKDLNLLMHVFWGTDAVTGKMNQPDNPVGLHAYLDMNPGKPHGAGMALPPDVLVMGIWCANNDLRKVHVIVWLRFFPSKSGNSYLLGSLKSSTMMPFGMPMLVTAGAFLNEIAIPGVEIEKSGDTRYPSMPIENIPEDMPEFTGKKKSDIQKQQNEWYTTTINRALSNPDALLSKAETVKFPMRLKKTYNPDEMIEIKKANDAFLQKMLPKI